MIFVNNKAEYFGSKFSSGYPTEIKLFKELLEGEAKFIMENDKLVLNEIASGQEVDFILTFGLYDENGEDIKNYPGPIPAMLISYGLDNVDSSDKVYYWMSGGTIVKCVSEDK